MRRSRGAKLLICLIWLWSCATGCTTRESKRILIIHSYEESYAGYPNCNRLIEQEFKKKGIDAELCIFYLDCESYTEENELLRMNQLLDSAASWKPEAIMVTDDQATYSLLQCKHPLTRKLPVVFGGVNYPNWNLIKQFSNVTGFHDKIDFLENINLVRSILGKDINFYTILDSTYIDRKVSDEFNEQLKNEKIIGHRKLTSEEREQYAKQGYTFLSLIQARNSITRDGDGGLLWALNKYEKEQCYLQFKRDFTTVNISNIAFSPSFTTINEGFDCGERLLGGYFTTIDIQIKEEVEAVARILRGEQPSEIPIRESGKVHIMDWHIMKQRSIPLSQIPSQCTIINMPFSVEYRGLWLFILIFSISFIVALISGLTFLYRREQKRKKSALHALADEKETLALAIEGSDTYAWKFEKDCFLFENAFLQSQQINKQTLTIEDFSSYIHPAHHELFWENWLKLAEAQKKISQVLCNFNGKGYQWWEFRYTTTQLDSENFRTAGLLLNIHAFKMREEELEEARKLAEKAELKESFLANMSHEIRTPLNAIVGFSTLLASDEEIEESEKQDYIQAISRNNELLLKLINDILELSRLKSGYMTFTFEKCNVADVVDGVYATYQLLIPSQLQFIKERHTDAEFEIDVDKNRLIQVITNFLNNACKFTKEGSIKLGYNHRQETGEIEIYVEDTGKGISPAEKNIIFTRFYKQDEFAQGTGLGLSICQNIIEKLKGRIGLESEEGKGSRFSIILPCKVVF